MALPIEAALPALRAAFAGEGRSVVLSADPGAGKTTRVPLALLDEPWLGSGKIIMLEPRRIAARRAAAWMASQLGEEPGETIGYRIRGETVAGKRTRIEVVTEGILTRMLQSDPALEGTALLIFDEFHERSIHADLGLALSLDAREHLRPDLRILVMSATLDVAGVSSIMRDALPVTSEGRIFPIVTHYLRQEHQGPVEPLVVSTVLRALSTEEGDVLVFLPGQGEIRRTEGLLSPKLPEDVRLHLLYGDAPQNVQRPALARAPKGTRKVILATAVAETSLTIDGVAIVVDAGLARSARFDPRRGMSGLVTTPVSKAAADQRRGRAGRERAGVCFRLWTERAHAELPGRTTPEILVADLAPLALELARWGSASLRFIDAPPEAHMRQARDLLTNLGALDAAGALTPHGRAMAALPVHPRLGHMLIRGKELGAAALACDLAALLEERNLVRGPAGAGSDIHEQWHALRTSPAGAAAREQAARLRGLVGAGNAARDDKRLGALLALAYPERVAKKREGRRYVLAGGAGAVVPEHSPLAREEYLAVADADGVAAEVKVYLAAPLDGGEIEKLFGDRFTSADEIAWNAADENVRARRVTRLGAIEISKKELPPATPGVAEAFLEGIRQIGLIALPWGEDHFRARSEWIRLERLGGEGWPDLSDEGLLTRLPEWLGPFIGGLTRRAQLSRLNMGEILRSMYTHRQWQDLDRLAPERLAVPTGSKIALTYEPGKPPVLPVRLQEMFGQTETPTVGGGRVKVVVHLLSPARRPLAVTQDLPSFWKNAYPQVRKEMRGQYPKHVWPEDPLSAEPTRRTKRRDRP